LGAATTDNQSTYLFYGGISGWGDAICQMTIYGILSRFPPLYISGVMLGNAVSGVIVSMVRIFTKLSYPATTEGLKQSSLLYFEISASCTLFCAVLVIVLHWIPYFAYTYKQKTHSQNAILPSENVSSDEFEAMPEYHSKRDPSNLEPVDIAQISPQIPSWKYYLKLLRHARHYLGAVNLDFMCSLALYPGIVSVISSPNLGDWLPVILFTLFQIGDFSGRLAVRWAPSRIKNGGESGGAQLLVLAVIRIVIFIPSLTAVAYIGKSYPSTLIDTLSCIIVSLLAVTNGYLGTLAMMYATTSIRFEDNGRGLSDSIHAKEKEFISMTMALFLMLGLSIGSCWGLVLEAIFF